MSKRKSRNLSVPAETRNTKHKTTPKGQQQLTADCENDHGLVPSVPPQNQAIHARVARIIPQLRNHVGASTSSSRRSMLTKNACSASTSVARGGRASVQYRLGLAY